MREPERRLWLVLLAVSLVVVGVWALAFPAAFHADFPFGRAWVGIDGPYNEHLVRDVGALQLALAVVVAAAVRRPTITPVAAIAVLVFGVPHFLYHLTHLEPISVRDAVAQMVALGLQVLVPIRLLTAWRAGAVEAAA